jgi:hypothetical protein
MLKNIFSPSYRPAGGSGSFFHFTQKASRSTSGIFVKI